MWFSFVVTCWQRLVVLVNRIWYYYSVYVWTLGVLTVVLELKRIHVFSFHALLSSFLLLVFWCFLSCVYTSLYFLWQFLGFLIYLFSILWINPYTCMNRKLCMVCVGFPPWLIIEIFLWPKNKNKNGWGEIGVCNP